VANSPEHFVHLMEQHSAPILLAREALGERWSPAREALVCVVRAAGVARRLEFRARVPYYVTTL